MKLRIKGNSIRLRLTRSEVSILESGGNMEEKTHFPGGVFAYELSVSPTVEALSANFQNSRIIVQIPEALAKGWAGNDTVGFSNSVKLTETSSLFILVEKDFICLDETNEDQSDNYENPNKTC